MLVNPQRQCIMIRATLLLLLLLFTTTEADILSAKIYQALSGSLACIRRLNETHQVGCGGGDNAYGILKMISEEGQESDLRAIVEDQSEPAVAVITASQMSNKLLMMTLKSCCPGHLKGILVLETKRPAAFSPDRPCPNEYSSFYVNDSQLGHCRSQEAWNLPGVGLAYEDFPFPIILMRNQSQVELTLKKIAQHGSKSYPKLAAQIDAQMFAAKNSVSCLRRSTHMAVFSLSETYCSPLGGKNLFYHSINLTTTPVIEPRSVVVLAARQDSFSLFDTAALGADSAVSSMVVVLAIAEMLHQDPGVRATIASAKKSFLLALFDGEAFDYIGSSETAYRMLHKQFIMAKPRSDDLLNKFASLKLSHISHFIELNQLLQYGDGSQPHQLFLHQNVKPTQEIRNLLANIKHEASKLPNLKTIEVDEGHPLPPSSAQSFLKAFQNDNSNKSSSSSNPLNVLVVTNHKTKYLNPYYNSYLENGVRKGMGPGEVVSLEVLVLRLTSIATLFGRVLYQLVTELDIGSAHTTPAVLQANETLVRQLLHCYLNDSNCDLFRQAVRMKEPQVNGSLPPLSTYVSVIDNRNDLRRYTLQVLRRFTGEKMTMARNATECRQLKENDKDVQFSYQWITGEGMKGECLRSTAYNVSTVSPAYDEATGLAVEALLAEGYRLWTESRWTAVRVRLFLAPSGLLQTITLLAGVATFALSLLVVYLLDKDSDRLFAGEGNFDDLTSSITSCLVTGTHGTATSSSSSSSSSNTGGSSANNIKGVSNVKESGAAAAGVGVGGN